MFIGHFAIGFAAKRFAPRTSLGLLIAATQLSDILWPPFLLLGWERMRIDPGNTRFTPFDLEWFPWSHSMLMCIVWATLFAGLYYAFSRYKPGAVAIWIGVFSHWVLDWMTHRPDMPLYPGSPRYGLGLWNSIAGTLMVESAMFLAGIWLYATATRSRDRVGRYGFLSYVGFLVLVYVADRFSAPTESWREVAWTALVAMPVFLLWPWWFDRHREPRALLP